MRQKWLLLSVALLVTAGLVGPPALGADPWYAWRLSGDGELRATGRDRLPFPAPARAQPAAQYEEPLVRSGAPPVRSEVPLARALAPFAGPRGKLEAALADRMERAGPGELFDVVVQVHGDPAVVAGALRADVRHLYRRAVQGFAARLTREQIRQLGALPAVQRVQEDGPVTMMLDDATDWTGARQARRDFSVTGDADGMSTSYSTRDVVIAIVDTGIAPASGTQGGGSGAD
jgi:subtilisin family serine protease